MNLVFAAVIFVIIGISFGAEYMTTKPDYLKTCQRNKPDAEFVACSTESYQLLFKKLATGIEGLDTLPPIDPYKLNKLKIFGGDGPVSINTALSNAIVTGLSDTLVLRSYLNPADFSWESDMRIPKLRIEANYDMTGRILVVPLNGHGKCWIEAHGMNIKTRTKSILYEKFDHIFNNVTRLSVDYKLTGLKLHFDNLFDGIKVLEDSTNEYLNANWKIVSDAFKPIITKTMEEILLDILRKFFNFMPADFIISDVPHPSKLYGKA